MATEAQNLSRLSPNVVVGHPDGVCLSHRDHHPKPPILPNLPTVYNLFMQNKANSFKDKINATFFAAKNYENEFCRKLQENKPNQTHTTGWTAEEIPFLLKKGQNPDNVKLNLVIDGKGTVWIDDIRLLKGSLE